MLHCPNLSGSEKQKPCTVPIFELETLKILFFFVSWGQYSVFASLSLKDWDSTAFLHAWTQKHWDSTAFSAPGELEVLYCPKLFGTQTQKHCTVPIFELDTLKTAFLLV